MHFIDKVCSFGLQHGRLYGTSSEEALLCALILQSEQGDMPSATVAVPAEYTVLLKHGSKSATKSLEQWRGLRGTPPQECEAQFLNKAAAFDTFGIDPHPVKLESAESSQSTGTTASGKTATGQSAAVFLGYNHFGLIAYHGSRQIAHLQWAHVLKMMYEKRAFRVHYMLAGTVQVQHVFIHYYY